MNLCWQPLLEKEMAAHPSILAWRIPWTEELGGPQSTGRRVGHDWATSLSLHFHFVDKDTSLLFIMLSRLVIAFLPKSKRLSISWLQSLSAVILKPKKIKSVTVSIVSPSICHEVKGLDAMIFVFECCVLSQLFHSPLSLSSRGTLVPFCFLP